MNNTINEFPFTQRNLSESTLDPAAIFDYLKDLSEDTKNYFNLYLKDEELTNFFLEKEHHQYFFFSTKDFLMKYTLHGDPKELEFYKSTKGSSYESKPRIFVSNHDIFSAERICFAQSPLDCVAHFDKNPNLNRNTLYIAYMVEDLSKHPRVLKQVTNVLNSAYNLSENLKESKTFNHLSIDPKTSLNSLNHTLINAKMLGFDYTISPIKDITKREITFNSNAPDPILQSDLFYHLKNNDSTVNGDESSFKVSFPLTYQNTDKINKSLNTIAQSDLYKIKTPTGTSFLQDQVVDHYHQKQNNKTQQKL